MRMAKSILILGMAATLCAVLASCAKKETANPEKKRVAVVTTLFPLYDFARNVGQDKADVTLLLPPGVEAHTFEPRPGDIVRISVADVFVYTGRFMEPWVDDLLKSITNKTLIVVDSSEGVRLIEGTDQHEEAGDAVQENHHHGGMDPHIWLDFSNAQEMVDTICAAMAKKDPQNKDFYIKNAGEYKFQLDRLDQEYREALASCKYRTIIHAGHFAFGYLAKRYNLTFLSAYKGFTPDAEPTPKNMSELIEKTKQSGVKYVYYEELISPKVARTLAEETGVGLLPLNGAHNVSKEAMARGDTFLSIMQRNLESLKKGLECQ
jgi:zinc transport system substrate-binding protein